ncbi:hypothetical protein KCP78_05840 [Salmonella enterica subsp. enterica]|nr:hypothetical protein KCP78_05840 [Salmonella enterica subsp. enterica]
MSTTIVKKFSARSLKTRFSCIRCCCCSPKTAKLWFPLPRRFQPVLPMLISQNPDIRAELNGNTPTGRHSHNCADGELGRRA